MARLCAVWICRSRWVTVERQGFTGGRGLEAARWEELGEAFLTEAVRDIWTGVNTIGTISLDQRATLRIATTHAIRLAVEVVDTVYNAAGATTIYKGHLLQRLFQDIHVISQHIQSRRTHYEFVCRHWLGLPIDETRL